MTPRQLEFMAKCDHRKTCERLVTLNASSYADSYYWCACGACPYYTNENAKLRDERDRMYKANVEKNGEILRLLSENAKLRELCERMFKDFVSCDCELRARAGRTFMAFTRYALELRELGIEVDG